MISSITVGKTKLTGDIKIKGGSGVDIAEKNRSVALDFNSSVLNTPSTYADITGGGPGYVASIQGVSATDTGDFFILGDTCTSITDADEQGGGLQLFDGCSACSSCDKVVQVAAMLQDCSIWLNGLKDCLLYYQPGAKALWQQMLSQRHKFPDNCKIIRTVTQETRTQSFKQATKLLYQYKAAVTMWNYLATTKSGNTTIQDARQDYGGFIVMSKRTIDLCAPNGGLPGKINLCINITLQSGQLSPGGGKYNLCVVVLPAQQNTYIQNTTDTGGAKNTGATPTQTHIVTEQTGIKVRSCISFSPSAACRAVFSGALKILPVIVNYEQKPEESQSVVPVSGPQIDLKAFANRRKFATEITDEQQVSQNTWLIQTYWQYSVGNLTMNKETSLQTRYYRTGYSKYPKQEESNSGSNAES